MQQFKNNLTISNKVISQKNINKINKINTYTLSNINLSIGSDE